ncbi:hypothetical protein [Bradyrhizobium sp. McL0616]|uniref:hypothetical protein n=1 Tax=Bradyrhizobium sp. McL0616 TaxID=3415674 RepID=UPI003CF1CE50
MQNISTGLGTFLSISGANVLTTSIPGWVAIGAEQTATGYDVAWRYGSANTYAVWSTDSSGRYLSTLLDSVPGTNASLEALETTFHQDLNGDGTIGVPVITGTTIEASGSTKLVVSGNSYYLQSISTGVGPILSLSGTNLLTTSIPGWVAIGAEQTATGYDVAWRYGSANTYAVWSTNSSGRYLSTLLDSVSGTNASLEALETTFQQDLNGDGTISVPAVTGTTIEASGSTKLVVSGNYYYLQNISTGVGPILSLSGTNLSTTSIPGWVVIGAEQTATGYDVAWRYGSANNYAVWSTDSSGRYLSTLLDSVPGTNASLEALETTFHQDLNGDGTIGVPAVASTTIEASGSTKLVVSGDYYYLQSISTGVGPILSLPGTNLSTTSIPGWVAIGAEQTATGYDVAWRYGSANTYAVWSTDSSGRYLSTLLDSVPGTNASLEALESSFHQDLNGDGVIVLSGSGTIINANSLIVGGGASVELVGAYSGTISFAGATGTLVIDQSTKFSGTLSGQLTTTNFIDLRDVTAGASATVSYSGNNSPGNLNVSDGTNTAHVALSGNYSLGNFILSSDGNGGTMLVDPPLSTNQGSEVLASSSDTASSWDSIDAKLALWSQHNASAFPSSPFDAGLSGTTGISEIGGVNPAFQLATSATTQQHYQSALS